MFDTQTAVADSIKELNYENENRAKATVKAAIRDIIQQQDIIAKASATMVEIQKSIKAIKVEKVEVIVGL